MGDPGLDQLGSTTWCTPRLAVEFVDDMSAGAEREPSIETEAKIEYFERGKSARLPRGERGWKLTITSAYIAFFGLFGRHAADNGHRQARS